VLGLAQARTATRELEGTALRTHDRAATLSEVVLDILVVDDDSELRELLKRSFAREGHRVTAVADGRSAIDRASTDRFDVILLDVAMGEGPDGYEVARTLRARGNVVPIVMLTALDSEADAVLGLEAGADDYVTKPLRPTELRSRIRAVLRRSGPRALGEGVLGTGALKLDRARREVTVDGRLVEITFSEFELMNALMSDPGHVFSRQDLLRAIWGDGAYRDPRGIDVHVRHLREKLEEQPDRPRLIQTVRGVGYRLNPD
jgi:DNA-binding response OmpR family regulator